MQRKTRFSLHFRVHGKFGEAKVTKKREQNKETRFFFCRDGVTSPIFIGKVTNII